MHRLPVLHVYSRPGCHLCEQLVEELLPLVRGRGKVEIRNIDSSEDLQQKYGLRIPVLEHEGRVLCEFHLDRASVEETLRRASPGPAT